MIDDRWQSDFAAVSKSLMHEALIEVPRRAYHATHTAGTRAYD